MARSERDGSERVYDAIFEGSEDGAPEGEPRRPEDSSRPGPLVRISEEPPHILPTLTLDDLVPFPGAVLPILLDTQARRDAILHARSNNGFFALVNRLPSGGDDKEDRGQSDLAATASLAGAMLGAAREPEEAQDRHLRAGDETPTPGGERPLSLADLAKVGVAARIVRVFQLPDQRLSALVELVRRIQPVEILRRDPFLVLRVLYPSEIISDDRDLEMTFRQVRITLAKFLEAHPSIPDELRMTAAGIEIPGLLADFVAQHLSRDNAERLAFLGELDTTRRMRRALEVAVRELDLLTVGNRITQEIHAEVEKHQREFFLRQQLKAIRTELGEEKEPATLAIEALARRLDDAGLPEHARARADEEMQRLRLVPSESPEHNVVRSYLEWIASLPWSRLSEDDRDIVRARQILDADHYGLQEVKDRIIEFLAVRQLNPEGGGTLLCFAGPPGVGKTSLGQSIARALGRQFYRFSVGGMRDEAEIKGHRRTYIGAMPGRVLQALKQVGTRNPLIMIDEIDKMGSDWRGDPSSAMLEVLDPAQNSSFLDHYLDLSFDLSRVMFIGTANVKAEIPAPLLDRLEVIDLPGYIPEEKVEIAQRHLVRRQREAHGLNSRQIRIGLPTLRRIIQSYTHEAGVRELDRQIGKLCRKRATAIVRGNLDPAPEPALDPAFDPTKATIRPDDLPALLGPPKVPDDQLAFRRRPGVAVGLAWTAVGGEVLIIEAVSMPGKGVVKVTGSLGEVMSESASIAMSYVRARAEQLGIDVEQFEKRDVHVHFPAGAVRKDGPSAGVTITTALVSLFTGVPVATRLAMTGEMTLQGEVLPVGGIREKVVAARRAGVRTVVLPERNRADVVEIPEEVRARLAFVFAETYDDVYAAALKKKADRPSKTSKREGRAVRRETPKTRAGS